MAEIIYKTGNRKQRVRNSVKKYGKSVIKKFCILALKVLLRSLLKNMNKKKK